MSHIRDDLRVLFIEDSETVVHSILRELRKHGYAPSWERVATLSTLREALQRRDWQLVISDSNVPNLQAVDALATTKELAPDVPFIVVSEPIEPEDSGIGKDTLGQLGAAIAHALRPAASDSPSHRFDDLPGATQELDRRRSVSEVDDASARLLATLRHSLDTAQRSEGTARDKSLADSIGIIDRALQRRELAIDLPQEQLEQMGLSAALRWLAERYGKTADLAIDLDLDAMPPLSTPTTTACFRIVQEALTNIVRHAEAREATVQLHTSDLAIQLVVRDRGNGFDTANAWHAAEAGTTLGLSMMRERVTRGGGQLQIESKPGHGTTVTAWFPMTREAPT
ncbi:MAG: domain S-box protein [Myxococcales bacterium]|nr:domain S-box protein [Myxococcales bacterium]